MLTRATMDVLNLASGQALHADGTISAPGISWANESNSGFYRFGAGIFSNVVNGAQVWSWSPTQFNLEPAVTFTVLGKAAFADGTLAAPGISWVGEQTLGLRRVGAGTMQFVVDGVGAVGIGKTQMLFPLGSDISFLNAGGSSQEALHASPDTSLYVGRGGFSVVNIKASALVVQSGGATVSGSFKAASVIGPFFPANEHELTTHSPGAEYICGFRQGGGLGNGIKVNMAGTGSQSFFYMDCYASAGRNFAIWTNSGIWNTQANNVNASDAAAKQNIAPSPDYTAFVEQLQFKRFSYVDAPNGETDGVIAQDIAGLDASLVTSVEGTLGVYEHRLQQRINSVIPKLIARIKALEAK